MNKKLPCLLMVLVSLSAVGLADHDYSWEPGTVTGAEVRRAEKLPHLGQYLYVTRNHPPRPDPNRGVWNMMKIDIPERWTISTIKIKDSSISIVTSAGRFELTSGNIGLLFSAIGDLGRRPSDDVLQQVWVTHAFVESAH